MDEHSVIHNNTNTSSIAEYKGFLIAGKQKTDVSVPGNVVDTAIQSFRTLAETREHLKAAKNAGEKTYKVIIKPELQAGLKSGELTWDGFSATLRQADNKRIAGQIKVNKVEIDNLSKAQTAISGITKLICSISGQIQLAEISKKLDKIQETVNQIREEAWRERISELNAHSQFVRNIQQRKFLYEDNAKVLIYPTINDIEKLLEFFKQSIENELEKNIKLNLFYSAGESISHFFRSKKNDYNSNFINKFKELLRDYAYLVNLYTEARNLLYICYQFIGEYPIAESKYEDSVLFIQKTNAELYSRIMYNFNIIAPNNSNNSVFLNLNKLLENQGVYMLESLQDADAKTNNNVPLISNIEIEVDVGLLMEVEADD